MSKDIFLKLQPENLKAIAEIRHLDCKFLPKNEIIPKLCDHVNSVGLSVLFGKLISLPTVKDVADACQWDDDEKNVKVKPPLVKKIMETIEEKTAKVFFESLKKSILETILRKAGVNDMGSKAVNVNILLKTIDDIGLEVIFSSCPESKLKAFVKSCGLKTDSQTSNILVRALVDQESIKAEYKPRAGETPSEIQPEIDKDITVVDLHTHYFRDDLVDWLNNHNLSSTGSKKVLIDRIRRFFDGTLSIKDSSKPRKRKTKEDDDVSGEGGDVAKETNTETKVEEKEDIKEKRKRVVEKEDVKEKRKKVVEKDESSSEENPIPKNKKKKN